MSSVRVRLLAIILLGKKGNPPNTMNTSELKKVGLKATLPRLRILQILESSPERHMSAESVYRALLEGGDDVGLATVYRVLTQFEAAGLVVRHNFDGGHAVFELETPEHHDHMVDVDSGEVVEFYDETLERLQKDIAEKHGYHLEEHSLVLYVRKPRRD